MTADAKILELCDVSVDEGGSYDSGLRGASLCLGRGDVALVEVAGHQSETPVADAAMGLCELAHGEARFHGVPWPEMSPVEVFEARARVGRVFGGSAWLSNLDLDENILLATRHHRGALAAELESEMRVLAERFGVTAALQKRPAWVSRSERQRAQWVRALVGAPDVLILEHPERDVGDTVPLRDAVKTACDRGAAVIWLTTGDAEEQKDAFPNAQRFRILNQAWLPDTI